MSVSDGKLATSGRNIRITPVPKPTSSFLPIACTSVILKALERLMFRRITTLFGPVSDANQFAYKNPRSPMDAVATLTHSLLSSLDAHAKRARACFFDFSSAFNTVDRNILLSKLIKLRMDNSLLSWMVDYLSNRKQCTSMNGISSSFLPVDRGVLQGAILSPFLFSIYIKDLRGTPNNLLLKFADDLVVSHGILNRQGTEELGDFVNRLVADTEDLKLKLNVDKCHEINFHLTFIITSSFIY